MLVKNCIVCKAEFTPDKNHSFQKYCSVKCRRYANSVKNNPDYKPRGKKNTGRHCQLCGANIKNGFFCERCSGYYVHFIYRSTTIGCSRTNLPNK